MAEESITLGTQGIETLDQSNPTYVEESITIGDQDTETLDQSNPTYDGKDIDLSVTLSRPSGEEANRTLTINNTGDSNNKVTIKELLGSSRDNGITNYNLGENAYVVYEAGVAGSTTGNTTNFNLSNDATLELSANFMSETFIHRVNINMGPDAASTLIVNTEVVIHNSFRAPTLSGLKAGDQIIVPDATEISFNERDGQLLFTNSNGTIARFNLDGFTPGEDLSFDPSTGTFYACFLRGTHMTTPEGQTKVEDLKAGDELVTASGGVATVKWVGYRKLYKSRIPAADAVRAFPILIKKDAIADNVPHADLTVSPGHHMYFDGVLVPAMKLVNGKTIIQQFQMRSFEYFHIELEGFDILLAENAPAESYVDTGNRSMFQNAKEVALNPDFGPATGRPKIDGITVARTGEAVNKINKQLLERAELLASSESNQKTA
ncbi:MAG: Hint domain-containing protein [Alcaligenaceae bacterium]|nr:Hint domain-containing protein [Alcaligenaceae bacterium]